MTIATPKLRSSPPADGNRLQPLGHWPATAIRSLQSMRTVARIVVASVRGSAPREPGTCMLVESSRTYGTIGGGRLEWIAIDAARTLLLRNKGPAAGVHRLVLGTQLGQCCGGVVDLWIEKLTRADLPLLAEATRAAQSGSATLISEIHRDRVARRIVRQFGAAQSQVLFDRGVDGDVRLSEGLGERLPLVQLYGAGHVGQALMRVLAELPLRLRVIDSRASMLPPASADHLDVVCTDDAIATVVAAPPGTHFIVMTHSHTLDYELCRAILRRNDHGWVGLIGSKSKAARFRSRLAADGVATASIARLTCPIGVTGIVSKEPGVIAVSIATQLLQVFEHSQSSATRDGSLAASPAPATESSNCSGDCASCGRAAS